MIGLHFSISADCSVRQASFPHQNAAAQASFQQAATHIMSMSVDFKYRAMSEACLNSCWSEVQRLSGVIACMAVLR
jgi:hypothetical protein